MRKLITALTMAAVLAIPAPAHAWQLECAPEGEPMFDARVVLDLSFRDGDPAVLNFYESPISNVGTVGQQAALLNTLAFVQRDLRPLFDKLPGEQLQITWAATVGYAFSTGIVMNQNADPDSAYIVQLFLHELGHVWENNMGSQAEREAFMDSLPWKDLLDPQTPWTSPHLPHSMRPQEAYANQFAADVAPCQWSF